MSFKKFRSIETVKQAYPHLLLTKHNFIPANLPPYPVSDYFREAIEFNLTVPRAKYGCPPSKTTD